MADTNWDIFFISTTFTWDLNPFYKHLLAIARLPNFIDIVYFFSRKIFFFMKQRHDCFQFFECLFALLSVIINVRHEKPFSTTTFDCGTNKYSKLSTFSSDCFFSWITSILFLFISRFFCHLYFLASVNAIAS